MMLAAVLLLLVSANVATAQTSLGGYLMWNFNASNAYSPSDTPFPPAILRGTVPGNERVVTTCMDKGQWTITGLNIISGEGQFCA